MAQSENVQFGDGLGTAEDDETDLGRYTEAYGSAHRSQTTVHVDMRHRRRGEGKERRAERLSGGSVRGSTIRGSRRKKRTLVKAGDIVGDKARGTEAVIENFDLYLSTVGVTGKGKFDAEFGGAIERVWIVREENVGHIAADERLHTGKGLLPLAAGITFALIIDADEIDGGAFESNLCIFVS